MMNRKKMFIVKTTWYVFNPDKKTYSKAEISGNLLALKQVPNYKWLVAENPYPTPGREFLIAEKGTGYVLAYGMTAQAAYERAVARFKVETAEDYLRPSDIRQLLNYQLVLLRNFISADEASKIKPDLSGFQISIPPQTFHPRIRNNK